MAGEIGLTEQEIAAEWNKALRSLNSKLAPLQAPPNVAVKALESNPNIVRVPDADQQSMYSVLVDLTGGMVALMLANNRRIAEQLKAAGIDF